MPGDVVPSGYPTAILQGAGDARYLCGHCRLVLRRAQQSECGHRFCEDCIRSLVSVGHATCPQCIRERSGDDDDDDVGILSGNHFADNAFNRVLRKLAVRCEHESCSWRGRYPLYDDHVAQCVHRPQSCICGANVPTDAFDEHELSECPLRKELCSFCKQPVTVRDVEKHWSTCVGKKVGVEGQLSHRTLCPFGCRQTAGSVEELRLHYSQCHVDHTSCNLRAVKQLQATLSLNKPPPPPPQQQQQQQQQQPHAGTGVAPSLTAASQHFHRELRILENKAATLTQKTIITQQDISKQNEGHDQFMTGLNSVTSKVSKLDRTLRLMDIQVSDIDLRVDYLEKADYTGTLLWPISEFSRRRQEAVSGRTNSLYSPTFYTARTGYKLCARIYLNGDGTGKGSHVSLFLVMLRGDFDALLPWPFRQKVTFTFIDQHGVDHVVDAFRPDASSASFQRPVSEMNVASGCPLFMPLSRLDDPRQGYVVTNTGFIKISVDMDGQENLEY